MTLLNSKTQSQILDNIIDMTRSLGYRQRDLAEYLGIRENKISQWKLGQSHSYLDSLDKIAEFLGVEKEELIQPDALAKYERKLSPNEVHLVESYRKLLPSHQKIVDGFIESIIQMYNQPENTKKKKK